MSPVHEMCDFVHSIYACQQIHVWIQTCFQWSEATLDGSRILSQHVRSLVVRGYSSYTTTWQAVLTGGLEEPICKRTNTNLSALYLFLTCTRPPDPNRRNTRRILQMHKNACNQNHRTRVTIVSCFYCKVLSRSQHWGCQYYRQHWG